MPAGLFLPPVLESPVSPNPKRLRIPVPAAPRGRLEANLPATAETTTAGYNSPRSRCSSKSPRPFFDELRVRSGPIIALGFATPSSRRGRSPIKQMHRYLKIGAAREVRHLLQEWFDLPG